MAYTGESQFLFRDGQGQGIQSSGRLKQANSRAQRSVPTESRLIPGFTGRLRHTPL
jgi:hypothetical protein